MTLVRQTMSSLRLPRMIFFRRKAISPAQSIILFSGRNFWISIRVNPSDFDTIISMAKQKRKSNKMIYWLIGAVAVLLIFIVVGKSAGWIGKPREIEVELAKAKRATIVEKVSASGTVQPVTEVKIAPEVSGEIIDLMIEEGDSVRKGQTLVRIRPDIWQSALDRAEAGLSQQGANLEQSQSNYQRAKATFIRAKQEFVRQKRLHDEKVISDSDWQLAQQNYNVARSDSAAAAQAV